MAEGGAPSSPSSPRLTSKDGRLIRELVESHCGLSYSLDSPSFLERRVMPRLRSLGLGSFQDYYLYLKYDEGGPQELGILIEHLTNHETYFFRERYQLDAFRLEVIPMLIAMRGRQGHLSIWSAGCSTGEETYTIAMLLRDEPALEGWKMRVFGTDISRPVLRKARAGRYTESSFREIRPEERRRHFHRDGDRWSVNEDVRALTAFGHLNLLNQQKLLLLGGCDVIFCRNVLIYLSAEARSAIVESFYRRLRPGGVLMLGHSESLISVKTSFELLNLEHDLVYQKPLEDDD